MNRIYGYVRISTPKQNIERQIRNIRAAYPDAVIVEDAYTGTNMNRKRSLKVWSSAFTGKM